MSPAGPAAAIITAAGLTIDPNLGFLFALGLAIAGAYGSVRLVAGQRMKLLAEVRNLNSEDLDRARKALTEENARLYERVDALEAQHDRDRVRIRELEDRETELELKCNRLQARLDELVARFGKGPASA